MGFVVALKVEFVVVWVVIREVALEVLWGSSWGGL